MRGLSAADNEEESQTTAQESLADAEAESAAAADVQAADAAVTSAEQAANAKMNAALRGSSGTQMPTLGKVPSDWQGMPAAADLTAFSSGTSADGWFSSNGTAWRNTVTAGSLSAMSSMTGGDNRPTDGNGNLLAGWQLTLNAEGINPNPTGVLSGSYLYNYNFNSSQYGRGFGLTQGVIGMGTSVMPGVQNLNSSPGDGTRLSGDQLRSHLSRTYASVDTPPTLTPAFSIEANNGQVRSTYMAGTGTSTPSGTGYIPPWTVAPIGMYSATSAAADVSANLAAHSRVFKGCFAAGTPVLTPDGDQPIESLQVGDRVLARPENDPDAPTRVQVIEELFRDVAPIFELRLGGQVIETTAEHRFFVSGKGWCPAIDLQPGDQIPGCDYHLTAVESVQATGRFQNIYNFRVSEDHTYFVGAVSWGLSAWVHNEYQKPAGSGATDASETDDGPKMLYSDGKTYKNFNEAATEAERLATIIVIAIKQKNTDNIDELERNYFHALGEARKMRDKSNATTVRLNSLPAGFREDDGHQKDRIMARGTLRAQSMEMQSTLDNYDFTIGAMEGAKNTCYVIVGAGAVIVLAPAGGLIVAGYAGYKAGQSLALRRQDGQTWSESVTGTAGDISGVGALYTGISARDFGTGEVLNLTEEERGRLFGSGVVAAGTLVVMPLTKNPPAAAARPSIGPAGGVVVGETSAPGTTVVMLGIPPSKAFPTSIVEASAGSAGRGGMTSFMRTTPGQTAMSGEAVIVIVDRAGTEGLAPIGNRNPFNLDLNGRNGILSEIDDAGIIMFKINAEGSPVRGTDMFRQMMEHYGSEAKGIRGYWVSRANSPTNLNLGKVNQLTSQGMSLEEAVGQAWTANRARDFGFTNIRIVDHRGTAGNYEMIEVIFTK